MSHDYNRRNGGCIFPGYRWCGPRCSGPGLPVNEVDACCMHHDLCLRSGADRCHCDHLFMDCLRHHTRGPYPENRHAQIMYGAMRVKTWFLC